MTTTIESAATPSGDSVAAGPVPHPPHPSPASGPPAPPPPAKDPRRQALFRFAVSISVLTIVGHVLLGFEQAPIVPITSVLVAYATAIVLEYVDAWAYGRTPEFAGSRTNLFYFLLPAHIAALACSMLLYADAIPYYAFAVVVSVGSKYVFRVRTNGRLRHFLNPSNFGIALTLLLVPIVGFVPPYMFLNNPDQPWDWLIPIAILMAGTMLNAGLTKKIPLIAGWVGGYVLQAVLRALLFDENIWAPLGMMTGVAFVLYTNYMITDPGTTPVKRRPQMIFGLSVAAVYGALVSSGVAYAIFFALTIVCAVRGVTMWVGERRRVQQQGLAAGTPAGQGPAGQESTGQHRIEEERHAVA